MMRMRMMMMRRRGRRRMSTRSDASPVPSTKRAYQTAKQYIPGAPDASGMTWYDLWQGTSFTNSARF
jgi:hypothetical protein